MLLKQLQFQVSAVSEYDYVYSMYIYADQYDATVVRNEARGGERTILADPHGTESQLSNSVARSLY
jgi:hypothetical protein